MIFYGDVDRQGKNKKSKDFKFFLDGDVDGQGKNKKNERKQNSWLWE